MHGQTDLFASHPPANRTDTSRAAAEEIAESADSLRQRVLEYIVSRGDRGATDLEIQRALHMSGDTERPRRGELCAFGNARIYDSGQRRKTQSGRLAIVWVAHKWLRG